MAPRHRPIRSSGGFWFRPIKTIRRSTHNARRCARLTRTVPQALSGYRPKLSVTAAGGYNYFREVPKSVNQQTFPNTVIYSSVGELLGTRQFGATATETLFNGFQTANRTRQAESQVMGARETLRVTEQQVLLDAATAYTGSCCAIRRSSILIVATSKCSPSN